MLIYVICFISIVSNLVPIIAPTPNIVSRFNSLSLHAHTSLSKSSMCSDVFMSIPTSSQCGSSHSTSHVPQIDYPSNLLLHAYLLLIMLCLQLLMPLFKIIYHILAHWLIHMSCLRIQLISCFLLGLPLLRVCDSIVKPNSKFFSAIKL